MANKQKTVTRQQGIVFEGWGEKKVYHPNGGSPGTYSQRAVDPTTNTVQYVPYSNDDWKKRIARGQGVTSTLLGTKLRFKGTMVDAEKRYYLNNVVAWSFRYMCDLPLGGSILLPENSGAADSGRASALAAEKLVADYYGKRSSVNGGAIMAEAVETVRGLASPAKALRKEIGNLYHSLRKNLYRSARRQGKDAAKVIGGTWLEWKFAVDPLIKDVGDAADAINKMSTGDFRHTIPIRGVGMDELITFQGFQGVAISGIPTAAKTYCRRIDLCQVILRAAIRVKPGDGAEVPLAWQFSTGVEDIAPSVLEAIPWSWFVDYFVNVSSVIQAWSIIGGNIAWSNRTTRSSRTQIWSPCVGIENTTGPSRVENSVFHPGGALAEYTDVQRSAANWESLMPPLRLRVPNTSTRWANLAALSTMYTDLKEIQYQRIDTDRLKGRRRGNIGSYERVTRRGR